MRLLRGKAKVILVTSPAELLGAREEVGHLISLLLLANVLVEHLPPGQGAICAEAATQRETIIFRDALRLQQVGALLVAGGLTTG